MNSRMLFVGSIVFVSNVVFAYTLVLEPQPTELVAQLPCSYEEELAKKLIDRGLEASVAKKLSSKSAKTPALARVQLEKISASLSLSKDSIYNYIASQALYDKSVDLHSYGDVVAMLQKINGVALDTDTIKTIQKLVG